MDINMDPGFNRTSDPDMVPGSSPRQDVIMALTGIAGHPDPLFFMKVDYH